MVNGKSGYFDIAGTRGFFIRVYWKEKYVILTNKSKLELESVEARSVNSYGGTFFPDGTISVDGNVVKEMDYMSPATHSVPISVNGAWNQIVRANKPDHGEDPYPWPAGEIAHNADGTKNVTFTVDLRLWRPSSANYTMTEAIVSGSYTISLTTIPRLSDLTAEDGTLGEELALTVTKQADDFLHTIKFSCGTASGTICAKSNETSILWEPPVSLAAQNTTGASVTVTLTIETFSGSTSIGEKSVPITLAIPTSVVPSVEIVDTDPTGNRDKFGYYVQNKSTCKVSLAAEGAYGSKPKSYSITLGKSRSSKNPAAFELPSSGAITITAKVTDSRGRTASASKTIQVAAYSVPTMVVSAYRSDSEGQADGTGAYLSVHFSAAVTELSGNNVCRYTVQYRPQGESSWTSITPTATGYNPEETVTVDAEVGKSYEARLTVSDSFSTVSSVTIPVMSAYALTHIDKKNNRIGFGKVAEGTDIFDVGLNARFRKDVAFENPIPLSSGGMGKDFSSMPPNAILRNSGNGTGLGYTEPSKGALYYTGSAIKFGDLPAGMGAKVYFTLAQLGITEFPTTMSEVCSAMPNNSVLIIDSRNIISGGAEEISDLGISSYSSGMYLFMKGNSVARIAIIHVYGATGATTTRHDYGTYASSNDAVVWKFGDVSNATYPDCFYRTVDGVTEWVNPPMAIGTEYRTTERWNKKPVYTKIVDCGTITNGGTFTYTTETVKPVRFAGYVSGGALPFLMEIALNSTWKMWVDVQGSTILARVGSGYTNSAARIYVQVWYVK